MSCSSASTARPAGAAPPVAAFSKTPLGVSWAGLILRRWTQRSNVAGLRSSALVRLSLPSGSEQNAMRAMPAIDVVSDADVALRW